MREIFDLRVFGLLVLVSFISIVLLNFLGFISNFSSNSGNRQAEITAKLIDKTLVQCYALEGSYPPSIEYLSTNYGIQLQKDNFYYYFESVGSNIKPIVQVIPRN